MQPTSVVPSGVAPSTCSAASMTQIRHPTFVVAGDLIVATFGVGGPWYLVYMAVVLVVVAKLHMQSSATLHSLNRQWTSSCSCCQDCLWVSSVLYALLPHEIFSLPLLHGFEEPLLGPVCRGLCPRFVPYHSSQLWLLCCCKWNILSIRCSP